MKCLTKTEILNELKRLGHKVARPINCQINGTDGGIWLDDGRVAMVNRLTDDSLKVLIRWGPGTPELTGLSEQYMWALTVSYWPGAAEAGMKPVLTHGFDEGAQFYRPTTIRFKQQPTKTDFEVVVQQTPWMECAWEGLMPLIKKWPVVEPGYKRATVSIRQEGAQVGQIDIHREDLWERR